MIKNLNNPVISNSISNKVLSFSVNKFYFFEILKLLLNVYRRKIIFDELKIFNLYAATEENIQLKEIDEYLDEDNFLNTTNDRITGELLFRDVTYFVNFFRIKLRNQNNEYIINFNFAESEIPSENVAYELLQYSFRTCSTFRKGCIEIHYDPVEDSDINGIAATKVLPAESSLENIFVSDHIKHEVNRFIYAFKNFETLNLPLRYILSGKPGLGKTEVVRSMINECSRHGTVIIPDGRHCAINLIFDFAKLFTPSIVCIDDLDLLLGTRSDNHNPAELGEFLNNLDGILQNKVFLIATTNDKKLVDLAASRPGRFDSIIDFGNLERQHYLPLLNQRTNDGRIIDLFNEEVLGLLEENAATGAFIVNLIKQIKIMIELNPEFSIQDLKVYISNSYRGFYKSQVKKEVSFGFTNARNNEES